jgi:hypothetical protein
MEKIQRWLEMCHERRNSQEFDVVAPVVGDEGVGKSTLMLELTGRWQRLTGDDPSPDSVLDRVVWDDRDEFRTALAEYPRRAAIPVMDAAHVLYKRDATDPEQKKTEKGLLDVRTREFLILLGYQSWRDIPTSLQRRRAFAVLRIPRRGRVVGYSRTTLDSKVAQYDADEWPEPDLVDAFPSLDGTDLWDEYRERDREHKRARLQPDDDEDDDQEPELTPRELCQEVRAEGVNRVVSIHGGNGQPYIDADLIEADYGVSARTAKKVKSLLEREVVLEEVV